MVKNSPAMQETWVQSLGWKDPLEKGTHFSILAWRIPWTEEPGGLQSVGLQRVRHNWVTNTHTHTHTHTHTQIFINCCVNFNKCLLNFQYSSVLEMVLNHYPLECGLGLVIHFYWIEYGKQNKITFPCRNWAGTSLIINIDITRNKPCCYEHTVIM